MKHWWVKSEPRACWWDDFARRAPDEIRTTASLDEMAVLSQRRLAVLRLSREELETIVVLDRALP